MSNLVSARGLTVRYGGKAVLDDAAIEIPEGCVVGLVGENGAGKTTLIRGLLGLCRPDGGTVRLFGEEIFPEGDEARFRRLKESVGVVLDSCPFVDDLSVATVGKLMEAAYAGWNGESFLALLRKYGIDPKAKVKSLSRGMGMKLQLACALAHDPSLLILDEATAGLDPIAREDLLDSLREFMAHDGRGILLSSHITSDLEKIADRIVCIDAGRIVFDMDKDAICDHAGIARCRKAEFRMLADVGFLGEGALRFIERKTEVDVLVEDRLLFSSRFPEIVCERCSLDEWMQLFLKGERS